MSKIEILCPNGHRILINTLPHTKFLKILEEACLKQGFIPFNDYVVKHGRKVLPLSSSIQQANIPNLAKLELIKSDKPWIETNVMVQLQTSNGEKYQREFSPCTTLIQLLASFEKNDGKGGHAKLLYSNEKDVHPVIVYISEEIIGEYALKETTLKSLGLVGGRISLRHLFRIASKEIINEIKESIHKELERHKKLTKHYDELINSNLCTYNNDGNQAEFKDHFIPPTDINSEYFSVPMEIETSNDNKKTENIKGISKEIRVIDKKFKEDSIAAQPQTTNNIMQNPVFNIQFTSQPLATLMDFKFPEESKGKNIYNNELSKVNKEDFQPCDRQCILYKLNDSNASFQAMELEEPSDQFFEVNEHDLKILHRDLQRNVKQLEELPLLTSSTRKIIMQEKFSQYKRVILRIQFPDRNILQAVFQPKETIFALYKFVKENLDDKTIEFHLFTSPPKIYLNDMSATFVDANLVPMTLVYFSSPAKKETYLSKEILSNLSSREQANENVSQNIISEISYVEKKRDNEENLRHKKLINLEQSTSSSKDAKIPKWLISGLKK